MLGALARNLGNVPNLRIGDARWDQPTDDKRYGRALILPFGFMADISDEPWITAPWATQSTSGVQVSATVIETFPDGTSTTSGVIVAPP